MCENERKGYVQEKKVINKTSMIGYNRIAAKKEREREKEHGFETLKFGIASVEES